MKLLPRVLEQVLRRPLPVFLVLQSALLLSRLDLLPVWGDEQFTLTAAQQSLSRLLEMVGRDIHPPLYFVLVHFWLKIPWQASPEIACRALSALFALAATVVIDRFWLAGLRQSTRCWFLALWTFSPCLVLYARMARSYSLQLLLTCIAVRLATSLLQGPRNARNVICFSGTAACLLYVHYLPGIAVIAATTLWLGWESIRRRRPGLLVTAIAVDVLAGLLYIPWLHFLYQGLEQIAGSRAYSPAGSAALAPALRTVYGCFSFVFGETVPPLMLAATIVLAPAVLWLVYRGASRGASWLPLVALLAVIAFAGVSRWVSFAFVPARLLYLLPFFLLLAVMGAEAHPRLRAVTFAGLLFVSVGSLSSYFQRRDFLNKAYLAPYRQIADIIDRSPAEGNAVLIVDMLNSDPWPLLAKLKHDIPVIRVLGDSSVESLLGQIRQREPETIWYFRNTHDPSPGLIHERLEQELERTRAIRRFHFVPYSPLDRRMMKLLGWRNQPEYYMQLLEMRQFRGSLSYDRRNCYGDADCAGP